MTEPADTTGYRGPVTLRLADRAASFEVEADLRGKSAHVTGQ